jgi:hypothetical protein
MRDIDIEGSVFECGGMDKRLILSRLPGELKTASLSENTVIPLTSAKEARLFVRVIQEDGHRAWSSPMYISRK